jgi:hypothetical protein
VLLSPKNNARNECLFLEKEREIEIDFNCQQKILVLRERERVFSFQK